MQAATAKETAQRRANATGKAMVAYKVGNGQWLYSSLLAFQASWSESARAFSPETFFPQDLAHCRWPGMDAIRAAGFLGYGDGIARDFSLKGFQPSAFSLRYWHWLRDGFGQEPMWGIR